MAIHLKSIHWKWILLLSPPGFVMGVLSVYGSIDNAPGLLAISMVVSALVVSKFLSHLIFIHSLLIGVSWSVIRATIEWLCFYTYAANNGWTEKDMDIVTENPRYFMLFTVPIIGLCTGAFIGGLSVAFTMFWEKRKKGNQGG